MRMPKKIKDASIQKKLTLAMWAVAIIPITVIFAVVLGVFIRTSAENATHQSQLLLDKTVEEVDAAFLQAKDSMESLITDMNVQSALNDYVEGTYKERLNLRDFLRNSLINLPASGMGAANISIYIKEADKTYSRDLSDRELSAIYGGTPWFEELLSQRGFFRLEEGNSIEGGRPAWILASSIVNVHNGQILGLLYIELDRQEVLCPLEELMAENGGMVILKKPGDGAGKDAGGGFVSLYSDSEFLGTVEYRLSLKELREGYSAALFYFLVGLAVLTILIYLVDKALADWFSGRIIRLKEATRRIASGDLDVEVEDELGDEIGELAKSFNTMARDMKRLIENEYLVKIENQQATLKALQSQINPHFVYNTLESISMMALVRDHYEIVDMTQAFSRMMRYAMEDAARVTVEEELENVRSYVTIQRIRFPGRFQMDYSVEQGCMSLHLPRLTIQPLVENAFRHGFEDAPDHKRIRLFTGRREGCLRIRIFNDGAAIPAKRLERIRELLNPDCREDPMDCFALRNLSRRLRLLFGEGSRVVIRSKEGMGTVVSLRIPMGREKE